MFFYSWMLRSSICESLGSLAHSRLLCAFNFNEAALRVVLKPETYHEAAQQNIVVSNRLGRCIDHCFRSLFESILIEYKTLELNSLYLKPYIDYYGRF